MQEKNKYVRNLTIGAVTGGLIVGGAVFALNDRKPFVRDLIASYQVTTDTTIRTTDSLIRLEPTSQFLTSDQIEKMNELEIKSYTPSKDNYDVDLYGFTNGNLTDEDITTKQNQFENGNALLAITNYDNHDEYHVEARELPVNYENILEEIDVKTIDYDMVIMVRESRATNIQFTYFWLYSTVLGTCAGSLLGGIAYHKRKLSK